MSELYGFDQLQSQEGTAAVSFFHLRTAPGNTWPPLPPAEVNQVWIAFQELERTQWLGPAELEREQLAQARALLGHCARQVPYYQRLLTASGVVPEQVRSMEDFRRIPILSRRTYQQQFPEFRARALPAGTFPLGEEHTTGTSGVPIKLLKTNVCNLWWFACYLRDLSWCDIDPRGSLAAIRALPGNSDAERRRLLEGVSAPYWSRSLDPLLATGLSHGMDVHQDAPRQLEWLRRVRPDYLLSYPTNLERLAELVTRQGKPLAGLRAIQSFAETLTDEARARIEAAFGVPVKNAYSCSEAGYLASPCPEGHGLHVHAENVLLEVLDDRGRPCHAGQTGRVVLTTLHNFLTPFIRYEIMDEGTVGPASCPCGRALPLLSRALGRRHPALHLPDGRRKIVTGLVVGLRGLGGCRQFQIIQRAAGHVVIRVVPDPGWTAEHPGRIRRLVHEHFEAAVRTEVEVLDCLPPLPGGKVPVAINEIEDRTAPDPPAVEPIGPRAEDAGQAASPPGEGREVPENPFFFRLRTIPGNAWPPLPGAEGSAVWAAYLELDRTQWLDPTELERGQLAQARTLLAHCMAHVPYYRRLLTAADIVPQNIATLADFRRIPILPRRTYQECYADFRAHGLPAGTVHTGATRTAGSSGVPVEVLQTNVVDLWWKAFYLRDLRWCGIDPCGTLAAIRQFSAGSDAERGRLLQGVSLSSWGGPLHVLIESGPSHGMDIHQDPRRQLEWLRLVAPDYLLSFSSNLEFLAGLVRDEGRRLAGLRAIQSMAHTLTDEARARIEAAFGVPVKNTYSCNEAGYLASPCPEGHGLHVHAENVLLEVLDEQGRPCRPGQTGRVVLTALHNFLTPLIRYEIMDEVTLGPERCPCGRGLALLSGVSGRSRPFFLLPDGRWKLPTELPVGIRDLGGCRQFQVVQRAIDHVIVHVVPDRTWSDQHAGHVRRLVHRFFEAAIRVDVLVNDQPDLPPGGKLLDMVCELAPPQ
jgi:phenylacetate-CoA ligase